MLDDDELVEADGIYHDEKVIQYPWHVRDPAYNSKNWHETVNGQFKQWECLNRIFRHKKTKHYYVLTAVAVLTQLEFENGNQVGYYI